MTTQTNGGSDGGVSSSDTADPLRDSISIGINENRTRTRNIKVKVNRNITIEGSSNNNNNNGNVLEELPYVIWRSFVLPFFDRKDWNNVICLSKNIRTKFIGGTSGSSNSNSSTCVLEEEEEVLPPRWPDQRCFSTKVPPDMINKAITYDHMMMKMKKTSSTAAVSTETIAGVATETIAGVAAAETSSSSTTVGTSMARGGSIESFAVSSDGEYLAYGSMSAYIQIWNRWTGIKHLLSGSRRNRRRRNNYGVGPLGGGGGLDEYQSQPLPGDEDFKRGSAGAAESFGDHLVSRMSSTSTVGTILKFAPVGHVLACGFENHVYLWDISSVSSKRRKTRSTDCKRKTASSSSSGSTVPSQAPSHPHITGIQTIEVDRKSTIYEVTYVDFSHDNSRLVVRYGKTAYIYGLVMTEPKDSNATTSFIDTVGRSVPSSISDPVSTPSTSSSSSYKLMYRIPLSSSRCTMATSNCLNFLAVTNNGSSGNLDEKGSIDIWHFHDKKARSERTTSAFSSSSSSSLSFDEEMMADENNTEEVVQVSSYRIDAHTGRQVIRGLQFFNPNNIYNNSNIGDDSAPTATSSNCPWLISSTLQGAIKIWVYDQDNATSSNRKKKCDDLMGPANDNCTKNQSVAAHANKDITEGAEDDDESTCPYICIYSFQTPGKIFSMATSSSSVDSSTSISSSINPHSSYLAVGQGRGQIRMWKLIISKGEDDSSETMDTVTSDNVSGRHLPVKSNTTTSQVSLKECLVMNDVGDHTSALHQDNIKLLEFTGGGTQQIIASRAYDGKIYFRNFPAF